MNIVIRVMSSILGKFNNFVDNLDRKYLDMIRQISIFVVGALWITGLILGYTHGRGAAKKTGIKIIDSTNDVLSIDVDLAKEDNLFKDVLKEELKEEMSSPEYSKEVIYEPHDLKEELKTEIFEADTDKKETPVFTPITKDGISELPVIDKTSRETDSSGIIQKEETVVPDANRRKDGMTIENSNKTSDVNTINKNDGIIE